MTPLKLDACCGKRVNPRGGDREASYAPDLPEVKIPRKVIKVRLRHSLDSLR